MFANFTVKSPKYIRVGVLASFRNDVAHEISFPEKYLLKTYIHLTNTQGDLYQNLMKTPTIKAKC